MLVEVCHTPWHVRCFSGKSSIAYYQIMMRDDYGFKARRKNLISKEAQKGLGADNPYDPEVIDDPE